MKRILLKILIFIIVSNTALVYAQSNQQAFIANTYYSQAEYDKALALYQELEDKEDIVPIIHNNYLELLHMKQLNNKAENYLKKIRAQAPTNVMYSVDQIDHYIIVNDSSAAKNYFKELEDNIIDNPNLLRAAAQYLVNKQHLDFAEQLYLAARKSQNNPYAFAVQLATLYRYRNQLDKMVEEYLKYAEESPARVRYVKGMLQLTLKERDDIEKLIQNMMVSIQKDPKNEVYAEILIWANLQIDNFYGAFIQSKALDRRSGTEGENTFEIGKLALENKSYESAIEALQYIIVNYQNSRYYLPAKQFLIMAKKESIENRFPVDSLKIRELIKDYQQFIDEQGLNQYTLAAYREKALLHAFYLNETEQAIVILEEIIESNKSSQRLKSQAKIDLADIYIITNQPWESTLLYSQVEKTDKNEDLGEIAKLKNAKVSFYTGNFKLAQEHLSILKKTTRREISNNAIDLSILIKNNTIVDSTQAALRAYAAIDLLLYQNKLAEAENKIQNILPDYQEHPIVDELYWLNAQIEIKRGNYEQASLLLEKIVIELPYDILTDDALFERAKILEEHLDNEELAQELYQQLLVEYPGSIFVAEARKRFRTLRGDFIN